MKIENVSNKGNFPKTVNLSLPKNSGGRVQIDLKPGQIVYGEIMDNNSTLRIYAHKRIVEITEDENAPEGLSMYKAYESSVVNEAKVPKSIREEISASIKNKEQDLSGSNQVVNAMINAEEVEASEIVVEVNEVEIEVQVPEGVIKNKGGRPKGVKNKPKKGRPRKKKTTKKKKK